MKVDVNTKEIIVTAGDIGRGDGFIWSQQLYMRVEPGGYYQNHCLQKHAMDKDNVHCINVLSGALIVLSRDTVVLRKVKCKVVEDEG